MILKEYICTLCGYTIDEEYDMDTEDFTSDYDDRDTDENY